MKKLAVSLIVILTLIAGSIGTVYATYQTSNDDVEFTTSRSDNIINVDLKIKTPVVLGG